MQAFIKGTSRNLSGWKKDRPDHRDLELRTLTRPASLPARADLRHICPPVTDQLNLGACVAHSTTEMMESLLIKENRPELPLSRLYVYYKTRVDIEGTEPRNDSGCQIRDAMKALNRYGSCLESAWGYNTAKFMDQPPATCDVSAKHHRILHYRSATTLYAIQHCLSQGYTLVGGFSVPENMMSDECAQTGIVKYPSPDEAMVGGHAVMFVGYDTGSRMFIFQNSWSDQWGNRGFGYLPFEFVTQGLADDFWCLFSEMT